MGIVVPDELSGNPVTTAPKSAGGGFFSKGFLLGKPKKAGSSSPTRPPAPKDVTNVALSVAQAPQEPGGSGNVPIAAPAVVVAVPSAIVEQDDPGSTSSDTEAEEESREAPEASDATAGSATAGAASGKGSRSSRRKKQQKKSQKKNKKKTKRAAPSAAVTPLPPPPPKAFRFGAVRVIECRRDVGGCGVPSDGSWGLALGDKIGVTAMSLEAHESLRTARLAERASHLSKRERKLCRGETRQWDYKGIDYGKNPLFGRLSERERKELLLTSVAGEGEEGELGEYHSLSTEFAERSRDLCKELDHLRHARASNGGCSCAPIKNIDKLSLARIKEELRARNLPAQGPKSELARALRGAVGAALCDTKNCECARNGLQCQADVCRCCACGGGHGARSGSGGKCANALGVYAYKEAKVTQYRAPFVTARPVEWDHGACDAAGCALSAQDGGSDGGGGGDADALAPAVAF